VNDLAEFLYEKYHKKLLWDHARLSLDRLHTYVKAIDETVGASIEIWGFINGTVRSIARPTKDQTIVSRAVASQAVVSPPKAVVIPTV